MTGQPRAKGPDGKTIKLKDLPLVVFRMQCDHIGKDYAVARNDLVFCETCQTIKRVKKIVAS